MSTLASIAKRHNLSSDQAVRLLRSNFSNTLDELLASTLNNLRNFSVDVDYSTKLSEVVNYGKIKVPEIVFESGADPKYRRSGGNLLQYIEKKGQRGMLHEARQIYDDSPEYRGKRRVKFSIVPVLSGKKRENDGFGRWDNSQTTTLAEVRRRKLRPATLRELVYFGNKYPYKHKKRVVIVACGTDIEHPNVKEHEWAVLVLQEFKCILGTWLHSDDDRRCGDIVPDPEFEPNFRLLAVQQ